MKFKFVLTLFICLGVSACGVKMETKKISAKDDERAGLTGFTPVQTEVSGNNVAAKLTVTPSSSVVRGYNVGAKISVQ